MEGKRKSNIIKEFWFVPLSVILILIIIFSGIRITITVGQSMFPTLQNGEMVLLDTKYKTIERYDVIVFQKAGVKTLIKRVIGLPGETIQIVDNDIYINNKKIKDAVNVQMNDYGILKEAVTLGKDEYFAMGDNRNNSSDCRVVGPVHKNEITGKVTFRLPSFNKINESEGANG